MKMIAVRKQLERLAELEERLAQVETVLAKGEEQAPSGWLEVYVEDVVQSALQMTRDELQNQIAAINALEIAPVSRYPDWLNSSAMRRLISDGRYQLTTRHEDDVATPLVEGWPVYVFDPLFDMWQRADD